MSHACSTWPPVYTNMDGSHSGQVRHAWMPVGLPPRTNSHQYYWHLTGHFYKNEKKEETKSEKTSEHGKCVVTFHCFFSFVKYLLSAWYKMEFLYTVCTLACTLVVNGRDVTAHVEAPLEQEPMHPGKNTVTYEARLLKALFLQLMWLNAQCLGLYVNCRYSLFAVWMFTSVENSSSYACKSTLCSEKKHPLTFFFISPWVMCRFKHKLQWIYLKDGGFWQCRK